MSQPCDAVTEIPTAVPTDPGIVQNTGYPDDCLARCCRIAGHEGQHFVVLALASGPGSFSMAWSSPAPPVDDTRATAHHLTVDDRG